MTDAQSDSAPERMTQSTQKAAGELKAAKTPKVETASFKSEPGWRSGAPEPAPMASARDLLAVGRDMATARREAFLAGADLWSRSFEPFYAMQSGMFRWFDDLWRETTSVLHPAQPFRAFSVAPLLGLPPVDVKETPEAYSLVVETPGLQEQDVEVSVDGDSLTLRGDKRQDREEVGCDYRLSERRFGRFERTFRVPQGVAHDRLSTSIRDGILTITLPKEHKGGASAAGAVRH
jgi:HSP20 family protein